MRPRLRLFLILLCPLLILLLFKDVWSLCWVRGRIQRLWPGTTLSAKRMTVWPACVALDHFVIIHKDAGRPEFRISGSKAGADFSLSRYFHTPLLYVRRADLNVEILDFNPWQLQDFSLHFLRHPRWPFLQASLRAGVLSYQDKEFKDISASFWVDSHQVLIHALKAAALGGQVVLRGRYDQGIFQAVISFQDIDLKKVMAFVGAGKAVDATGIFSGEVVVHIKGREILDIRGLLVSSGGGKFAVTDPALARQAVSAGQNENIVIENLKNYHYDIGKVELRNLAQDIQMDITLEGKTGRRSVEFVWHGKGLNEGS